MNVDGDLQWVSISARRGPADRGRKLMYDIRHELATVQLLASVVATSADVGPASLVRIQQLIDETRWLERLVNDLDELHARNGPAILRASPRPRERLRVDVVAGEVVAALQLATSTDVTLRAQRCEAAIDRLALWRVLRNVLDNACRAAGELGHVAVRVSRLDGWSVVQVDDDGPGFGAGPPRPGALGLDIVRELVGGHGGRVESRRGDLGGGCVRILLPRSRAHASYGNDLGDRGPDHAPAHL